MNFSAKIPNFIEDIYKKFHAKNFELYLIGGSVRNLLLFKNIKDWDMTTNATPREILKLFKNAFYDNQFGTVGLPVDNQVVEITTFRSESEYKDRRHPKKVTWGTSIEQDLKRRDFTINSIALKLSVENEQLIFDESNLIDPHGGRKDLEAGIVRAVGDPKQRFKEDALRLLRAIRIATELSFAIDKDTWKEIIADARLIREVSCERVRVELLRILASEHPYEGTMMLKDCGLLEHILPEIMEGIGVSQARPGRHHTTDVFTHNVQSLKHTPSSDPIVRLAALLHDVGKPKVAAADNEGFVIFHNHEIVGARMAREICERLKFSKKEKEKIYTLIRWHMFSVDEHLTDSAVRRFIRRIGVENVADMMELRVGDRLGGGTQTAESWRLKLFKKRVEEQLKPKPFSVEDMAVDGNDVMRELNIKPGPKVGEILRKLFEEVDENLALNNKEHLEKRIKELTS
ncbi:MAG: HD domain-containing protein [Candidatus Levybacteria bacterium]|nr:HD domain-containing protein [Candidatus Levybacteria bacterium]